MTEYVAFSPPPNNVFSFQPTLDGQTCVATAWWNIDGQRWFITVTGPDGIPLFNLPLIGSPYSSPIESIVWANGIATVTTSKPHGFAQLTTMDLTVIGCGPEVFNGVRESFVLDALRFQYALQSDPGDVEALGQTSYDINIGAGYLSSSTFVYREQSQMFEISP